MGNEYLNEDAKHTLDMTDHIIPAMSGSANPTKAFGKALGAYVFPASARNWDVICVGQTSFDTIHMDEGECARRVGGSAFIPANLMANLGLRIGLVSCWGTPHTQSTFAAPNLDLTGVIRRPEPAVRITLKYEKQNLFGLRISDRVTKFLSESQIPRDYYQTKFVYLTPASITLLCDVANHALAQVARVLFAP